MQKLLAALGLALVLSAFPAMAQTDADTDAAVESALGDHAVYRSAFDAIQQAVADGDKAGLAQWINYPLDVKIDGKDVIIKDGAEFEANYDAVLTDEIRTAIADQQWQDLFVNYQGIMFGNGQVWLNGVCKDEKCAAFDVKVMTIQSTADITPKAN